MFLESTVLYKNQADDSSEFAKIILVFGLEEENPINSINKNKSALFLDKLILNFLIFGKLYIYLLIYNQTFKINQIFNKKSFFFK